MKRKFAMIECKEYHILGDGVSDKQVKATFTEEEIILISTALGNCIVNEWNNVIAPITDWNNILEKLKKVLE